MLILGWKKDYAVLHSERESEAWKTAGSYSAKENTWPSLSLHVGHSAEGRRQEARSLGRHLLWRPHPVFLLQLWLLFCWSSSLRPQASPSRVGRVRPPVTEHPRHLPLSGLDSQDKLTEPNFRARPPHGLLPLWGCQHPTARKPAFWLRGQACGSRCTCAWEFKVHFQPRQIFGRKCIHEFPIECLNFILIKSLQN